MIELYHLWDSPCCFKVRMTLAEKGLEWTEHYVAAHRFEHFQPEYQKLNRHCRVPTLVHDGRTLIQSSDIARHLDDVFPGPSLQPEDPVARATMQEWISEEGEFLFPLIVTMSFNLMMTLRGGAFGMDVLREWSSRHPDQNRAQDYLRRVSAPPDETAVDAAAAKFRWHMTYLDETLQASGGPWICGEQITLADLSVAPLLDRVESLDRAMLWQDLPAVDAWFVAIKERPSFQKSAPPPEYRMWGPRKPPPAGLVDPDAAGNTFPAA
jgi:glutathione S-transferase